MPDRLNFAESEWKILRRLHVAALERFCERTLAECESEIDGAGTAHERYLRLFRLLRDRDGELADAFNDMRRSRAIQCLAAMRALGVVTDEEMEEFSPATRSVVDFLLENG